MKSFYLLFTLVLFYSCHKKEDGIKVNNNQFLEVYYRRPGALYPMTFTCPNIKHPLKEEKDGTWFNLKITDHTIVGEFYTAYLSLQPNPKAESQIDAKASIIFHLADKSDTICTNDFGQILLNGIPQKDNPKLFSIITKSIGKDYEDKRSKFEMDK